MKHQIGKEESDINVEAVYYDEFEEAEEFTESQLATSKDEEERLKIIKQ